MIEPTVVFVHIQKTAGTTMRYILGSYYDKERIFMPGPVGNRTLEELEETPLSAKENVDLLLGHFSYGVHQYLPRPPIYVTVLRQPVERVLSHYFHEKRDPTNLLHDRIQAGMGIADYVKHYANAGKMDNLQTRMLAGNWRRKGFGSCTDEMFELAKKNLEAHFVVAGLTERFDESYVLMKRALNWPEFVFSANRNATKNRPPRESVPEDVLEVVRSYNRYDLALYAFAEERFNAEIEAQGESFVQELAEYRAEREQVMGMHSWHLMNWIRQHSVRAYLKRMLGLE